MIRIRTLQNVHKLVMNVSIGDKNVSYVQIVIIPSRAASATSSLLNQQTSSRDIPLRLNMGSLTHSMKTQLPVTRQTTRSHPCQTYRDASDVSDTTLDNGKKEYFNAYSLTASTPRNTALRTGAT